MRLTKLLSGFCVVLAVSANAATTDDTAIPSTETGVLSYSMGYKTGQALKTQAVTIDPHTFSNGLKAGYQGMKPAISDETMQASPSKSQYKDQADKNAKAGQDFLAKNAKLPNVRTTNSGLQYQVVKEGEGDAPTLSDTVSVNYEGKLISGKVFDSSYERGQPATFKVGDVIPGWQEALMLMKPGATYMLYIPSNLAYGKQGSMGAIGPNEVLIFKVDLLSVKK